VVSPPTSAILCCEASPQKPSRKPSSQSASLSGKESDKVHHAGSAAIAARSERLTASAFQPMSAAAVSSGKCTPTLRVSVATTRCRPAGTCRIAASSPMPRMTSSRESARERMRSMRSNSKTLLLLREGRLPGARRANLGRAPLGGGVIEHAIDVGVAVLGAETLDRLDRLVDHHPVRHVEAVAKLVGGDAQGRQFDRVDLLDLAVEERLERAVEFFAVLVDAVHEVLEIRQVGDFLGLLVGELGDHLARIGARHLPGVDGLQCTTTRTRTRDRVDAIGTTTVHCSFSSRSTISIATSAASSPLLPWLPPARAWASSNFSTASTPLQTGSLWSSWTRIRPSEQPSATCS